MLTSYSELYTAVGSGYIYSLLMPGLPLTPVYLLVSVLLRRCCSPAIGRLVTTAFSIAVVVISLGWRPCLLVITLSGIMWTSFHSRDSRYFKISIHTNFGMGRF